MALSGLRHSTQWSGALMLTVTGMPQAWISAQRLPKWKNSVSFWVVESGAKITGIWINLFYTDVKLIQVKSNRQLAC